MLRLAYAKDRPNKTTRVAKNIRVKLLGKLHGLKVYTVRGDLIRLTIDIDYVMGGNAARYAYIPKNEIWIDADLNPVDAMATIKHEYVELVCMENGMSYDSAHDIASEAELRLRKKLADRAIKRINLNYARTT